MSSQPLYSLFCSEPDPWPAFHLRSCCCALVRLVCITQEKTLQSIVDAKAAAAQDVKMKKKQAADKSASNTVFGLQAVSQGNGRCGPGARSTSFGDARAQDDMMYANLRRGGGAAAGAAATGMTAGGSGGRSSPTTSSSTGRSSPTVECVVPALGAKLADELSASTAVELERHTTATLEQAKLFLSEGFMYDQIDRTLAVKLLAMVLEKHHSIVMKWETVELMVAGWERSSCDGDDDISGFEVPGISGETYFSVLAHYGAPSGEGGQKREWYVGGWPEDEDPTTAKFENEARLLAEHCLPGRALEAAEGSGARASPNGGPSRQAHGAQGGGNRGRKPRRNQNKATEDGLDG